MAEYFLGLGVPYRDNYIPDGVESYIQGDEAYDVLEDVRAESGADYTYPTFARECGQWIYCGHCLPGMKTEDPVWEYNGMYREFDVYGIGCTEEDEVPGFSVLVASIMGRDIRYFKVYDQLKKRVIRLSFDDNTAYDLDCGEPLWHPDHVPFERIKRWLGASNHEYPDITNWMHTIYRWNCENVYEIAEMEAFLSGTEDDFSREYYHGDRYVLSTTPMPDYNSKIAIIN
jgi:hypothetical protein